MHKSFRCMIILDGQNEIKAEIANLKTRLEGTEKTTESFGVRLNALEANVNETHRKLTTTAETVQDAVETQNTKFIALENYTRRSNLIVFKFQDSKISIENDYCAETRRKRKLLLQSAKAEKDAGKEVFLVEDRLRIGTDLYSWNDFSNSRQWLSKVKKHPAKA